MTTILTTEAPIVISPVRVEITYFNLHGKLKYEGCVFVMPDTQVFQLADELRLLFASGQRPGMSPAKDEAWVNSYIIHVDASALTNGYPFLITPRQANPLDVKELRKMTKDLADTVEKFSKIWQTVAATAENFTETWQTVAVHAKQWAEMQALADSVTTSSDEIGKLANKIGAANEQTISG